MYCGVEPATNCQRLKPRVLFVVPVFGGLATILLDFNRRCMSPEQETMSVRARRKWLGAKCRSPQASEASSHLQRFFFAFVAMSEKSWCSHLHALDMTLSLFVFCFSVAN